MLYKVAEYIWLDNNKKFRSKTKVIICERTCETTSEIDSIEFPPWDYDGSSTGQTDGKKSEITLRPVFVCDNPLNPAAFIGGTYKNNIRQSKLVLCETHHADGTPTTSNTRHFASKVFETCTEQKPWFGLEQEYFVFDKRIETTPHKLLFYETTEHYCGTGKDIEYRSLAEEHMLACTNAGITISGINAEVSKNQWEFQIGPSEGIKAADELLIARFLLERIAEKYGNTISYEPKPFSHINGSGCHANFSTLIMRTPCDDNAGIMEIYRVVNNLEKYHAEDIQHYGVSNEMRLSGNHETSSYNTFTSGIGDRGVSVRINNNTHNAGYGYFEDRRPAANMDPYLVTSILMKRTVDT
jgi:glutamine synthetase